MKSIKLLMDSPPLSESNYTSKSFLSLREVIVPRISTEFNGHTNCHKNAMIITSWTKFAHVNKQNLTFIESIIEDSNVTYYHKYAKYVTRLRQQSSAHTSSAFSARTDYTLDLLLGCPLLSKGIPPFQKFFNITLLKGVTPINVLEHLALLHCCIFVPSHDKVYCGWSMNNIM